MRAKHVADVTAKTLRETLVTQTSRKSYLMTDEALAYKSVGKEFSAHGSVNHSAEEYVRGMFWHTNTAESFFAILKRGVYGTFHSVSEQHLQRYANEFAFAGIRAQSLALMISTALLCYSKALLESV